MPTNSSPVRAVQTHQNVLTANVLTQCVTWWLQIWPVGCLKANRQFETHCFRFCLNINPLQAMYCMAQVKLICTVLAQLHSNSDRHRQAQVFVATASYFSSVAAQTSMGLVIVPDIKYGVHTCHGLRLCPKDDERFDSNYLRVDQISTKTLETSVMKWVNNVHK